MSAPVQVQNLKTGDGAYRVAAVSGLLTGVAAGTATAGHLFAMRWASTSPRARALIQRIRCAFVTIAGYTAAQEAGIDLSILRAYTAAHAGGTALTLTGNNAKKNTGLPTTFMAMRIADTGELTAGTQVFDAQPIARTAFAELAAAATVPKGRSEIVMGTTDLNGYPIVLAPNEGLCVRNAVLQGGGGTARLIVEVDWLEVTRF